MQYWLDNEFIRYSGNERGGMMHITYSGPEMDAYLEWLAEGNEPQQWEQPQ